MTTGKSSSDNINLNENVNNSNNLKQNYKSQLKLKVCGMKYEQNILDLVDLSIDYIGFIFYEKSPRYVGNNFNIDYLNSIKYNAKKVGVFVNSSIENIIEKTEKYNLQYIQLHGDESPDFCKLLKDKNYSIIKSFNIDNSFDFNIVNKYVSSCSYFLFDTKSTVLGGSGISFNWDILNNYNNQLPFFLSGGIDIDMINSIKSVKEKFNIYAIDINSKFEIKYGFKDIEKIKKFIALL